LLKWLQRAHVDEIAERAGVNKATLYYQIGDKDTLFANVIHRFSAIQPEYFCGRG